MEKKINSILKKRKHVFIFIQNVIGESCRFARQNQYTKEINYEMASISRVLLNWIVLGLAKEDKEPVDTYFMYHFFYGYHVVNTLRDQNLLCFLPSDYKVCPLKQQWLELYLGFYNFSTSFYFISVLYLFCLILAFQAIVLANTLPHKSQGSLSDMEIHNILQSFVSFAYFTQMF